MRLARQGLAGQDYYGTRPTRISLRINYDTPPGRAHACFNMLHHCYSFVMHARRMMHCSCSHKADASTLRSMPNQIMIPVQSHRQYSFMKGSQETHSLASEKGVCRATAVGRLIGFGARHVRAAQAHLTIRRQQRPLSARRCRRAAATVHRAAERHACCSLAGSRSARTRRMWAAAGCSKQVSGHR